MEKEILYEINRFREILGLPLLKESVGGGIIDEFLTLFGKSADDFEDLVKNGSTDIAKSLKNSFDEIAQLPGGKTIDDILSDIRTGNLSDELASTIAEKLVKSTNQEVSQKMANAFINTNPTLKKLSAEISSPNKFASANDEIKLDELYDEYYIKIDNLGESQEVKDELLVLLWVNYKNRKDIINAPNFVPDVVQDVTKVTTTTVTKEFTGLLDEFGELSEDTKIIVNDLATNLKVDPTVLQTKAKNFINQYKNLDITQLETKLAESQTKLKKIYSESNEVGRQEIKQKWDFFNSFLPKLNLTKPVKAALTVLTIGVIIASYVGLDYFSKTKEEAENLLKGLITSCPNNKITVDHVQTMGSDDGFDEYYAKVVYDGNLESVKQKEGAFYLSKKNAIGEEIQINCGDAKLADKTVEEIGGVKSAKDTTLTTMTKAKAIEAIKNNGYTEPITLTPDEENKTEYAYTDASGLTGTAKLTDGKIIVT
jgi:hypothetical protein